MNLPNDHKAPAAPLQGSVPDKCFVCHYPVVEPCFCKIPRAEGGPIMLCCPDCVMQHLDATCDSMDPQQQELRAYERSVHFFIGEDKPWS